MVSWEPIMVDPFAAHGMLTSLPMLSKNQIKMDALESIIDMNSMAGLGTRHSELSVRGKKGTIHSGPSCMLPFQMMMSFFNLYYLLVKEINKSHVPNFIPEEGCGVVSLLLRSTSWNRWRQLGDGGPEWRRITPLGMWLVHSGKLRLLKMAIEIVDLAIKKGDLPWLC